MNGGAEIKTPIGRLGTSLTYLWGKDDDKGTDNSLGASQYGIADHWRVQKGGFQANARAGWAHVDFDGTRRFSSGAGSALVERTMTSGWSGNLVTAKAHVAQQLWANALYLLPALDLDYSRLNEGAHRESGGGTALDLTVEKRTSDELAISGLLAVGLEVVTDVRSGSFFTVEIEGGRRQIIGGGLGDTIARFGTGPSFTLTPEERSNGWVNRLRALGGDREFRIVGDIGAEQQRDRTALSARLTLALGL